MGIKPWDIFFYNFMKTLETVRNLKFFSAYFNSRNSNMASKTSFTISKKKKSKLVQLICRRPKIKKLRFYYENRQFVVEWSVAFSIIIQWWNRTDWCCFFFITVNIPQRYVYLSIIFFFIDIQLFFLFLSRWIQSFLFLVHVN